MADVASLSTASGEESSGSGSSTVAEQALAIKCWGTDV